MILYQVKRYELVEFEVEAEDDWTREQILDAAQDPHNVTALKHTIKPRPPKDNPRLNAQKRPVY